jgi:hypothetical protein
MKQSTGNTGGARHCVVATLEVVADSEHESSAVEGGSALHTARLMSEDRHWYV